MLRILIAAFRAPKPVQSSTEESKRTIAKGVVRRAATGNVRLQLGNFVTKEDLDQQYERVKSYRFDDAGSAHR